ncbi:hypothetical protein K388_05569 [Streptomyces sp. KhCrAH-43]|nr:MULTISPECIES: hypothetical protein [unclassified Streptomyces]MYX67373.1 hypothetical protein [Streptomyces sp. SID8373]RAJ53782.1 hypothetical protein K388_05569 [Streptomyces sp. KhCrAH-43]
MTAPVSSGPPPFGGGPAPSQTLPAWEETSAEVARADDRYWDNLYVGDDD